MGKSTGFLEYERAVSKDVEPLERIKNYKEFHKYLPSDDQVTQGSRCMNCGVPFCQSGMTIMGMTSGCPLHNLIPEWNDLLSRGQYRLAYRRLAKTSNFPEFTSRVCPALCEAACTCGVYDDPVTTRENERAIIEYAFENGLVQAAPPASRTGKRIAVIGSGPSGLAAADLLNKRGHEVTVFERDDAPGGLLMYGIPNMKLEKTIVDRRISLMKQEGVVFELGVDVGRDVTAEELLEKFDRVILCAGSRNPRDLIAEGRDAEGIYFAVDYLTRSTKHVLKTVEADSALSAGIEEDKPFVSAKDKHVIIVGGGDTGNDCVGTAIRQGCASVTQLEMMPPAPAQRAEMNPWPEWPKVLKTDYGQQEAIAVFGDDPRIYETTVKSFIKDENGCLTGVEIVHLNWEKDPETGRFNMKFVESSEEVLPCELLLIAAGFLGSESYLTEAFGVEVDQRTNVVTQKGGFKTTNAKVFAAGDVHTGQSLVVKAIRQGREAAYAVDCDLMGYSNIPLN
ncbi:MAG: glutamate synthase subunit beta [Lachnospiraceae bacterium]|nr:glutamate synthase subunit beta [Candidatus Equihabitans merdae]